MRKFKFVTTKRNIPGGLTNGMRAAQAEAATEAACVKRGEHANADYDAIRDLLADIGHLCDREGLDFPKIINIAKKDWRAER